MPLRILFVPFGSEGDVNPLFWLAEGLAARGHEPVFLLTPHYARLAEQRGFRWIAVGTDEDFSRFARDPRLWNKYRGPEFVVRGMVRSLPEFRKAFAEAGDPIDLAITSSFALGAAAMAETKRIPRLTLHMQPVCLRSEFECPLFLPELAWIRRAPRFVKRAVFRLMDLTLWNFAQRPLNAFRRELGLDPLTAFYDQALHGASGVAALFPAWYAAPQPDWPPNLRQFGFPITKRSAPLPDEVERFLEAGPPPVLWTHGSANFDIRHFQACALSASEKLGRRCLLVSLDPPENPLGPGAFHAPHVRFEDLFPRCAAVVHHGGIGTTAKAVLSGVPQLIIPRSHDQPDNADRIVQMGIGKTLPYRGLDSPVLAETVKSLLDSETIAANCRAYRARMLADDSLPALCDWAEALARPSARPR